MKKSFKIILSILIFALFLSKIIPQLRINSRCVTYEDFKKRILQAVIVDRYIDSSQHSYHTLELRDLTDRSMSKLVLDFDTTGLFNFLKVQDTILKDRDCDSVFLIKNGEKRFLRKVDFGCAN